MQEKIGLYPVKLSLAGEMPGAPSLELDLLVTAPTGKVNGTARITQALPPPYGEIFIPDVTGQINHTGFGKDTMLVGLHGDYTVSVPPPAIGTYLAHFTAALAVDASWNGTGTYSYGKTTIANAKVTNVSADASQREPA
ncbi:MAG: DUF1842 domain-containing protein [Pseudomonadota bacterium]